MYPLSDDDDARTRAPSGLCFPHVAYNMAAVACSLEDISDMPDSKMNEWLNKAKWLLRVAHEQQVKSSASQCHAVFSRSSQMIATPNGDYFDAHTPQVGGAAVTPLATALTSHEPKAPSLSRSEGVTFLLGVPPCITGSVTIAMSVTPSKLGTTLRCSPIPLSNRAGMSLGSLWPLGVRDSDSRGSQP
jgi:hypothetical protein